MSDDANTANAVTRVAVFGSCVSRDVFNRTFNPHYKDLFECVAVSNHVSLVSLMAEPVVFDADDLNGLEPRIKNQLANEFNRTFLQDLKRLQPDYLVVDLWADLIFGFASHNGGRITNNAWSTVKTNFYLDAETNVFKIDQQTQTFMDEWKDAADRFFVFLAAAAPNTKVVLHSARNISGWIAKDGNEETFSPWAVSMNKYWDMMDSYLTARYVDRVIAIVTHKTKSFEDHPWGKFPVHYTFEYHPQFLSKLTQIVIADLRNQRSTKRN